MKQVRKIYEAAFKLKAIENNLNNRPKKVLGYKTPNEQMTQEINKHKGCL